MANNAKMVDGNLYRMAGMNIPKYANCDRSISQQQEVKKILRIIDEQDAVNRFIWSGIPMNLSSQEIERILYYKGSLAFFKYQDNYYLMPYALNGTIDFYGRFNTVSMIPMTGGEDSSSDKALKLLLNQIKRDVAYDVKLEEELQEGDELKYCVILRDYTNQLPQTNIPRQQLNDPILEEMSYLIPYMDTALIMSTGISGMRVTDADQKGDVLAANKTLKDAAATQNPFVPIIGPIEFQELGKGQSEKPSEYLLVMQSLDNLRLSTYGLDNGGLFEKKQHMLTAENEVNNTKSERIFNDSLTQRQNFCNIVNSIFGTSLWCEASETVLGDLNEDGFAVDTDPEAATSGSEYMKGEQNDSGI